MCENCDTIEIIKFQDSDSWDRFDFDLSKKLVTEKMKYLKNDEKVYKDKSLSIYQCSSCSQKWLLKAPSDYFGGGYFIKA